MPEIGETLREARMRERIDVSEIEAQTKIRAKYLRALENEEWDLLPGPTFVKSFLRTYAAALGLDGKALVEEYRLHYERPSEPPEPIVSSPRKVRVPRGSGAGGGPSRGYLALVGIVVRDCTSFGLPGYARISVRPVQDCRAFPTPCPPFQVHRCRLASGEA